jgi:hypothetical protein
MRAVHSSEEHGAARALGRAALGQIRTVASPNRDERMEMNESYESLASSLAAAIEACQ